MKISTLTPDELTNFARQAVLAKSAFWDALRAFENATTGNDEWSIRTNNEVIEYIDNLAACVGDDLADEDLVGLIEVARQ